MQTRYAQNFIHVESIRRYGHAKLLTYILVSRVMTQLSPVGENILSPASR
jgi:hypothetical protein